MNQAPGAHQGKVEGERSGADPGGFASALEPQALGPVSSGLPDVLSGRYRIERLLGAGGMGRVYLARDLLGEQFGDPDPYLALKLLNDELAAAPDACALLYSEFALTRRVRHDNVLRLYSFEVDLGCHQAFITMEFMRGLTLDQLVCERPLGLPWNELIAIVLPLLDALAHSHACGVLHGDIKPSNVLLGEDGVRLFDFGLGRAQDGDLTSLPHLNRDRFQAWTPGYVAPELIEGLPLTTRADVYSIACVIYELAGGRAPHRHLDPVNAREAAPKRHLPVPRNLPKRCWPALRKALSVNVAERKITAVQLRNALAGPESWLQRLLP